MHLPHDPAGEEQREGYKGHEKACWGEGFTHYLDCCDGSQLYTSAETHQTVYFNYAVYDMSIIPFLIVKNAHTSQEFYPEGIMNIKLYLRNV